MPVLSDAPNERNTPRDRHRERSDLLGRLSPRCAWHHFTTLAAHAVHVVEEMAAANIVAIELPEVDAYPHGEIEWGFASQGSDGWVNLDKGVITFDLAEDDGGETDGLPTVAEGRVPADLVKPFASALLAAAVRSTPTPGETP